jgi:chloride channel protein, CIC family
VASEPAVARTPASSAPPSSPPAPVTTVTAPTAPAQATSPAHKSPAQAAPAHTAPAQAPGGAPPLHRVRVPPPLLRRRLPSGRGATEQPNATGDGDAALTPRFWAALAAAGVAAGLFGDLLMLALHAVEHLAFGYQASSTLQAAVEHTPGSRRLIVLVIGGAAGGVAWYLLRRYTHGEQSDLDDVVWGDGARLSFRRSLGTAVISEVVIGMGASLGREAAPKLMGGACASALAGWAGLTPAQRRLLMACGAGAGLAAVYNVPLGGALFTAEVMLGSITVPVLLPALACSAIATAVGWLYLPDRATYLSVPGYRLTPALLAWALLAGPVIGLVACGYIRLIGWVSHHQATGRAVAVAPALALGVLGLVALAYPQLLGNGKDMAHDAFLGVSGLTLLLALFALKPLVTALCLGSGASGGLFTPTLSTGAALGGAAGIAWSLLWPGTPAGAYALVGAAAMLGAAMQAPMAALALVVELTRGGFALLVPMIAATVIATVIARRVDGYSIYTARLRGEPPASAAVQRENGVTRRSSRNHSTRRRPAGAPDAPAVPGTPRPR